MRNKSILIGALSLALASAGGVATARDAMHSDNERDATGRVGDVFQGTGNAIAAGAHGTMLGLRLGWARVTGQANSERTRQSTMLTRERMRARASAAGSSFRGERHCGKLSPECGVNTDRRTQRAPADIAEHANPPLQQLEGGQPSARGGGPVDDR